jgi:hypothetical protein
MVSHGVVAVLEGVTSTIKKETRSNSQSPWANMTHAKTRFLRNESWRASYSPMVIGSPMVEPRSRVRTPMAAYKNRNTIER